MMSKKDVKENASGSASGAGAIATTPGALGGKGKVRRRQPPETIFAVSEQDKEDIREIRKRAGLTEQWDDEDDDDEEEMWEVYHKAGEEVQYWARYLLMTFNGMKSQEQLRQAFTKSQDEIKYLMDALERVKRII